MIARGKGEASWEEGILWKGDEDYFNGRDKGGRLYVEERKEKEHVKVVLIKVKEIGSFFFTVGYVNFLGSLLSLRKK